ncbi:MAG: YkgJ family cysteine cluster protein [Candidatus Micrarchaeia archaeon]
MAKIELFNACKFCDAKCCRGLAVVLTIPEAIRLARAAGGNPADYIEITSVVDSKETPHYPIIVREMGALKEYFLILKKAGNGKDCVFLGQAGACRIYADRPHVCRLYPFALNGREMKKNALCPVKFQREGYIGEAARLLEADLHEHGRIVRAWLNANPGKRPQIGTFLEEAVKFIE